MEIRIGIAKTTKYALEHCGDSFDITERPHGGITAIIADGQGNGLAAHHTSSWVVNKAASLVADGARDGAVARAVHDYLYAIKDRKVSCTLTLLSADLDSETLVISRNSNCPAIVRTDDFLTVYDEEVAPIGVHRHMKPRMYELPLVPGMLAVSYTDGIAHAGRKQGDMADLQKILAIIQENSAADAAFVAQSILDYALTLDKQKAADDMTVVALGVVASESDAPKIERFQAAYPC